MAQVQLLVTGPRYRFAPTVEKVVTVPQVRVAVVEMERLFLGVAKKGRVRGSPQKTMDLFDHLVACIASELYA